MPALKTPSQTIGPFFGFALPYEGSEQLVAPSAPAAIVIEGRVLDGEGAPLPDAMIEIWQADPSGRYPERGVPPGGFSGFGRSFTDPDGRFHFVTVKPGRVQGPGGRPQAPHLDVLVFARGLLRQLVTRIYFPDEAPANAVDPVLAALESPAAQSSLVASAAPDGLKFDIHLQGERETAFFAL